MRRDIIGGEARALRQVVTELGRLAKTTPVPRQVRAQIVAFAERATGAGWSLPAIAQAVGVSVGSVRNWRHEPRVAALVPVVVTPSRVGARAALTLWPRLIAFLAHAGIPLDNNATERALRGVAVGRKNHYGSRSERGTRVAAVCYSLLESAKLAGLEPAAYLAEATRRAIANPVTVTLPRDLLLDTRAT